MKNFKYPEQSTRYFLRVKVVYQDEQVYGTIYRDDAGGSGVTIIKLDDGQMCLGSEIEFELTDLAKAAMKSRDRIANGKGMGGKNFKPGEKTALPKAPTKTTAVATGPSSVTIRGEPRKQDIPVNKLIVQSLLKKKITLSVEANGKLTKPSSDEKSIIAAMSGICTLHLHSDKVSAKRWIKFDKKGNFTDYSQSKTISEILENVH